MQGGVVGGGAFAGFGGQQALLAGMPGGAWFDQPAGDWGAALGMGVDPAGVEAPAGNDSAISTEQAESSTAAQHRSTDRQQVSVIRNDVLPCCSCLTLYATQKARLRSNARPKKRQASCGQGHIPASVGCLTSGSCYWQHSSPQYLPCERLYQQK